MGRGADPEDARAFGADALPPLRAAVLDLSWLRGRGYSERAAGTLVGDRYQLTDRQRAAVARCACPDAALPGRLARRVGSVVGEAVEVDGFNVLITVERGLAGGPVLVGRDGALRDVAGVHGTWHPVEQTGDAIARVGASLAGAAAVRWWLDRPVSNSGRLAGLLRDVAADRGWRWEIELAPSADAALLASSGVVATSDGGILDRGVRWFDAALAALDGHSDVWRVALG